MVYECVQQKCMKGQIGTCLLGTGWYNFLPCAPTLRARMHNVTDRQTDRYTDRQKDRRQDYANSQSYFVVSKNEKCDTVIQIEPWRLYLRMHVCK